MAESCQDPPYKMQERKWEIKWDINVERTYWHSALLTTGILSQGNVMQEDGQGGHVTSINHPTDDRQITRRVLHWMVYSHERHDSRIVTREWRGA